MAESASLLFKIKGDESDAVRALKNTESAAKDLTGGTAGLTSGLASLAGPAAAAAAAVVAVGTAALAVTSKLLDLSKAAADYGSAIYDASQQTGLTTETMSALKVAAEQAGSSFETITVDVAKFNVLLGQAATGNEKAQKVLQQYGITATETDKALEQAILHIAQMSSQSEQAAAATALFKDRTGEILPVIKSFDGDLPALIDKLRDLGLLMSKEDAAAADQFGDQMDTLNAQLDAVTRQIGFAVMPVFLKFATSLSNWLATNKSEITSWANTIGAAFSTASGWLIKIYDDARRALAAIQAIALVTAQGPSGIAQAATIVGTTEQRIQNDAISRSNPEVGTGTVDSETGTFTAGGASAAPKIKTTNIDRADSQADANAVLRAREIRDLTAQIAIENINLRTTQEGMAAAYEDIRKKLGEGTSIVGYTQATNEATKQWADNLQNSISFIEQLEIKALKKDATQAERDLLTAQQQDRRHQLKLKQDDEIKKNQDALFKTQEEQWAKQAKADADKAVADQEAFTREQEAIDLRIQQALGANILRGGGPSPADDEEGGGIFGAWTRSWDEFVERVAEDAPTLQDTFTDLLEIGRGAFEGMARAVGQLVQQWVIYGNTAPGAAKKALAGILAAVAAEAAVKAIMATAEGFFFLATHKYDSAANAFTAAAFYGTVAAVAAVTGRAVAGNSFNQQAGRATGQGQGSASGGGRGGGSGNQGEAYSPYGNQATVYEQSRNAPAAAVHVKISDDSQWLGKMLKFQIETNSDVRDSIRSTAEA